MVIPSPHTEDREDTRAGSIGYLNPPNGPKGSYPHDTGQPSDTEPAEPEAPQIETCLLKLVDGVYIPYYPLLPTLPHHKRLTRNTPVSSTIISNTELDPAAELNGFPSITHLQDNITRDLLRNMFGDQGEKEELAQRRSG